MRRSTYRKSEDSQDRVLDAAITVFAERGLTSTSIQDIAEAAGMSKGSVHYHFKNKDDLLLHVLRRCCHRAEERVRAAFDEPGLPIDRVRRAVFAMWALRRDETPEFRVLTDLHAQARQHPAIREALAVAFRKAREQIANDGFKRLLEMGLRLRISATIAPRLLIATLDGLALQQLLEPVGPDEELEVLRALELTALALFEV